jgi:hypothetical protein
MANRLFDRQLELLDYLTSSAAIFGDRDAPLGGALRDIDRGLLQLEARLSHGKRMDKIRGLFPRTFVIIGRDEAALMREFVEAYPPTDIGRLVNGRQFREFVVTRWQDRARRPRHLPDVAAIELAFAEVYALVADHRPDESLHRAPSGAIRRRRDIVLFRCAYDVRSIFADGGTAEPIERDTPLAVTMADGADQPLVVEVQPEAFDLLAALDDWLHPAAFRDIGDMSELVDALVAPGLLEVGQ